MRFDYNRAHPVTGSAAIQTNDNLFSDGPVCIINYCVTFGAIRSKALSDMNWERSNTGFGGLTRCVFTKNDKIISFCHSI